MATSAPLRTLEAARVAGHASVNTTTIYDLRGEETRRAAVNQYMDDHSPAANVLQLARRRISEGATPSSTATQGDRVA
ncbi:MAG: hypothetical protein ACR2MY_15440 [Candidatus Dormibacteria bacterium]